MAFGVLGAELMVRLGPAAWSGALELPPAQEMDFTGRSMRASSAGLCSPGRCHRSKPGRKSGRGASFASTGPLGSWPPDLRAIPAPCPLTLWPMHRL